MHFCLNILHILNDNQCINACIFRTFLSLYKVYIDKVGNLIHLHQILILKIKIFLTL